VKPANDAPQGEGSSRERSLAILYRRTGDDWNGKQAFLGVFGIMAGFILGVETAALPVCAARRSELWPVPLPLFCAVFLIAPATRSAAQSLRVAA
jgi:hypothetical protein